MRKLIFISLIVIGKITFGQESVTNWKQIDKSISLESYIYNRAFKYLEFNEESKDSIRTARIQISHGNYKVTRIQNNDEFNYPIVIINDYVLKNFSILNRIFLSDLININLTKASDQLSLSYGIAARYGLIEITMDKKKWKKMKRKKDK